MLSLYLQLLSIIDIQGSSLFYLRHDIKSCFLHEEIRLSKICVLCSNMHVSFIRLAFVMDQGMLVSWTDLCEILETFIVYIYICILAVLCLTLRNCISFIYIVCAFACVCACVCVYLSAYARACVRACLSLGLRTCTIVLRIIFLFTFMLGSRTPRTKFVLDQFR